MDVLETVSRMYPGDEWDHFIASREYYRNNGFLYQDSRSIVMAEDIGGSWFVALIAGDIGISSFLKLAPYELPFIIFRREKNGVTTLKVYRWSHLSRVAGLTKSKHGQESI